MGNTFKWTRHNSPVLASLNEIRALCASINRYRRAAFSKIRKCHLVLTHHLSRANGHYLRQELVLISRGTGHPAVTLKFAPSPEIRGVDGTSNHDQSLEESRQNFYNERLNLQMPLAKILSSRLQRRRINEAMNYWTPLSLERRARPPSPLNSPPPPHPPRLAALLSDTRGRRLTFFKDLLQHSSLDQLVSALAHGHLPLQSWGGKPGMTSWPNCTAIAKEIQWGGETYMSRVSLPPWLTHTHTTPAAAPCRSDKITLCCPHTSGSRTTDSIVKLLHSFNVQEYLLWTLVPFWQSSP